MEKIHRNVISIALAVALSFSLPANSVAAQSSLAEQEQALKMIADFADRICKDIPLTGGGLELTGKAKAELRGIFRKIAELGLEGAAKYQNYEGVIQKDLAKALKDSSTCKLEVFRELKDKILGAERSQKMITGSVVKLDQLPNIPSPTYEFGDWYMDWVKQFFANTRIVINRGSNDGIQEGDFFAVIYKETEVKGSGGESLGAIQEHGALVQVVKPYEKFSICKLSSYNYDQQLTRLESMLAKRETESAVVDLAKHIDILGPIVLGDKVIAIRRVEKEAKEQLDEFYGKTLDKDVGEMEKRVFHREMIRIADAYLLKYGNGYFAPNFLFSKGYAQFQLNRYEQAIETFELFIDRFPFSHSVPGAKDWIAKAKQRLK